MKERIAKVVTYCRRFDVALDIGAHVGAYSIEMANYFKMVIAYEPVTKNYAALIRNIQEYPTIIPNNVGVSDRTGDALFDISGKSNGCKIAGASVAIGETCKVIKLDDFPAAGPGFIKIDVEGHEYQVLRGAEKLIKRFKPVIMIEEKFDPERSASRWLESIGYWQEWHKKHDRIFVCKP